MRSASRTSMVPGSDFGKAIDPETVTNDQALVFLHRVGKRALDIIVATIGLILFSPILLLSSLAIVFDSRGPIVRTHIRHSYGNETFRVFKFRDTVIDGDLRASSKGSGLTRVGRILRLSGIDGLPQLINVLRGEMSIVGPCPYIKLPGANFEEQIPRISQQRRIKPGLTGWAQVHGYWNDSNSFGVMQRRIEYDLYYFENCSFLLDMKIILMTLYSRKTYALTQGTGDQ
jgi:lipopolysaccharide/colanic/teichoic acid biosynthesis glycosyltransferase